MSHYGYFDDDKHEYAITNPRTPVKWINYVGTLDFGGFVDQTGGMLICQGDPALNRITKYIPQLPNSDLKGSTLYLRFPTEQGYQLFSPFYTPVLQPYTRYECRVGMGYTHITSVTHQIEVDVLFFVPRGDHRVIWDIRITNQGDSPRAIDAVPLVEYTHFEAAKQFNNADWVPQTMQSKAHNVDGHLILTQYAFLHRDARVRYLTANLPVSSFESDRRFFLGDNEYGTWREPCALQQPELSSYEALRGDNIGALMIHLDTLQPGESKRLILQLGQAQSVDAGLPGIRKFWTEDAVDAAFATIKSYWTGYLDTVQVATPDTSMNSMLNVHHPRQCHTTKNWSRFLSLYQLGLGERGLGFRDSSQDVLGTMSHMPEEGKDLIVKLLHTQKCNGSAMHQFFPLNMVGTNGEAGTKPGVPAYYSDDHLWIIQSVCAYIKETGDTAFLEMDIPYYDKGDDDQPLESGTVFDHMVRAIEFTRNDTGAHGLPLAGFADWNDTVNMPGGAESVFTAHLYGVGLRELIGLCEHLGKSAWLEKFTTYYDEMKAKVNEVAWDGDWYVRYFDHKGQPVGSHKNAHGQIFTNGQSWPVLAGFAPPERAVKALDSVRERLNTSSGIKVSTPGFNGFDPMVGGISTYPPGAKENSGIFLHTNPWVMIAETMVGRGDRAFEYYNQINPAAKNDIIDEYECEPYAYAQNILSDEHPQFGLGRNSWLSGTAAWVYIAATQYILGVRPTYAGLIVDPCIPKEWDGFKISRNYRGSRFEIAVQNPNHVSKGVKSVTVDGKLIDGSLIPIFTDNIPHTVQVVMG